MAKARVKLNRKGIKELLKSKEVEDDLLRRAGAISDGAGGEAMGYTATSVVGKNRARASVMTTKYKAMKDNARNNTLIRNLDRGR